MPTAVRDVVRKAVRKQAVALLKLSPQQVEYYQELRDLFNKSDDPVEKDEIRDALLEIICSAGVGLEGNLESDIRPETKRRVRNYHRRVGEEIKRLRVAKGWNQTKLAKRAKIFQTHLSRIETNRHTPTHITIQKIAKALGTTPKMLDPGFD